MLAVAKAYGQSPGEVENWEERWFSRAVLLMEAENIFHENKAAERKKAIRRR